MEPIINEEIDLDMLCTLIVQEKVIPIIGFDLVECYEDGKPKDLLTMLAERYSSKFYGKKLLTGSGNKNGFDIINEVYHKANRNQKTAFGKNISDQIIEIRKNIRTIPEVYELLARIKGFKFYINATFINSLELAINTYKSSKDAAADGLMYDVVNYNPRESKDIEFNVANSNGEFSSKCFKRPTIYNLLATHDVSMGEYVITDVHYMELIVNILKNQKKEFTHFQEALNKAVLLFIGCNFPDWIFRFLIRIAVNEKMDSIDLVSRNYIIEQFMEGEPRKAFFINNYGITRFAKDPKIFVHELFNRLKAMDSNNIENSVYNNHVFISYNHADKEIAESINKQLNARFVDTWFDRTGLNNGDELDSNIEKAIREASVFVPIITNNVNTDVNVRRYYKREWNYAVERFMKNKDEMQILPVVLEGYNGNNTLQGGVFTLETRNTLLKDGDVYIAKEIIKGPDYTLSDEFITKLKEIQYKGRNSGLKNKALPNGTK